MTLLHVYFHLRDKQAFRRLLDTNHDRGSSSNASISTSAGKSRPRSSVLTMTMGSLVNTRDERGRTVLHLACASKDALDYVKILLAHPSIEVNLPDMESRWTPLHRALYNANIQAALLLLQRSDIDMSVRDYEGITSFELYNMTIRGTQPGAFSIPRTPVRAELFTWGTNKNATLGSGDGGDRSYPDHIVIQPKEASEVLQKKPVEARFSPIHVRQLQMSKLHTAVVTSEAQGNLRLCGFGNGGRLGQNQHMQYSLTPLSNFTSSIVAVALGQDHTLVLTDAGEVLSWGLNRFSQLGYVVEAPPSSSGSRVEEPIQVSPRKITLRKHVVKGIAASKSASACWTASEVLAWGANNGQFGFDKTSQPIQVYPRIVTQVTDPVISISLSDSLMACLLVTHEVLCFWNDRHFKLSFPVSNFPESNRYRPPHANKTGIEKLASCDDVFVALSTHGELFTFSPPSTAESGKEKARVEPQRVQALKRQYSRIQDVAVGQEGSIIFSTESGHVFVRTRSMSAPTSKTFKFQRVPLLQRVIGVAANNMGAYGALRLEYTVKPLLVYGNKFAQDMCKVEPWLYDPGKWYSNTEGGLKRKKREDIEREVRDAKTEAAASSRPAPRSRYSHDDDISDVLNDVIGLKKLCGVVEKEKADRAGGDASASKEGNPWSYSYAYGADVLVTLSNGATFPAHRVVLAARSSVLRSVLADVSTFKDSQSKVSLKATVPRVVDNHGQGRIKAHLSISGCHPLSLLILLHYLYSDELYAIWDRRVFNAAVVRGRPIHQVGIRQEQVVAELLDLARVLELHQSVLLCLRSPVKRYPTATLRRDMSAVYDEVQSMFPVEREVEVLQVGSPGSSPPKSKGKGKAKEVVVEEVREVRDTEQLDQGSPIAPDVVLELADRRVYCHSSILRARSEFFEAFFDEKIWTEKRVEDGNGILRIDLRHLKWRVCKFVMRFLCSGEGEEGETFEVLEFIDSVDELLEFMFQVLAAANELLLDRLVVLCSIVVLKFLSLHNACYILADATHYHIPDLIERVQEYISVNMEVFLESRMLDSLPAPLIEQLSKYVANQQSDPSPITRRDILYQQYLQKWGDWVALQDFPSYIVPSGRDREKDREKEEKKRGDGQTSPKAMARRPSKGWMSNVGSAAASPGVSPKLLPQGSRLGLQHQDEIFQLDMDAPPTPKPPAASSTAPGPAGSPWKPAVAPRVDIKTTMAEAAAAAQQQPRTLQRPAQPQPSVDHGSPALSKRSVSSSTTPASSGLAWRTREPVPVPSSSPKASGPTSFTASSIPTTPGPTSTPANVPSTPPRMQRQASAGTGATASPGHPGLGPVITPSRQVPSKNVAGSSRRVASNPWTMNPVEPISKLTQSTGMSFLAIQQMEMEKTVVHEKPKQSLLEIQKEEHDKRVEDEFLKWWKEEEERVRSETELMERAQAESASASAAPGPGKQQQRSQRHQRQGQDQQQQGARPRRESRRASTKDQNYQSKGQTADALYEGEGGSPGSKPQRGEGSRRSYRKPRGGQESHHNVHTQPTSESIENSGGAPAQTPMTPGGGRQRAPRSKNQ
ncbi:hypothetical protein AX16_004048 [Volvariella volvacea WC 439]|nr:hypothetical protein AX16_004048 [Volvariella volvacea WC 439]